MKKVIRGIIDFRKNVLPSRKDLFAKLATGQSPDALFISCSDSRVAPNWFASTDPGDLFVIRNIGNLVPPCTFSDTASTDHSVAAAIEFSLLNLKVTDIVVCGHSECGAMIALENGIEEVESAHLKHWLAHAEASLNFYRASVHTSHLSAHNALSQINVLQQIKHLKTHRLIQEAIESKKLRLHAWWFNIAEGGVYAYEEGLRSFVLIDEKEGTRLLHNE